MLVLVSGRMRESVVEIEHVAEVENVEGKFDKG